VGTKEVGRKQKITRAGAPYDKRFVIKLYMNQIKDKAIFKSAANTSLSRFLFYSTERYCRSIQRRTTTIFFSRYSFFAVYLFFGFHLSVLHSMDKSKEGNGLDYQEIQGENSILSHVLTNDLVRLEAKYRHRASLVDELQIGTVGNPDPNILLELFRKANLGTWVVDLHKDKLNHPLLFVLPGNFNTPSYLLFEKDEKLLVQLQKAPELMEIQKHLLKVSAYLASLLKEEESYIVSAERYMEVLKVGEEGLDAYLRVNEWIAILNAIFDAPELKMLEREGRKFLDEKLSHLDGYAIGDLHKKKLRQIIGFSSFQEYGTESEASTNNFVKIGDPIYLRGFFQHKLSSSGGLPSLVMKIRAKGSEEVLSSCQQPMYVPEYRRQEVENGYHYDFALFPDFDVLTFDSHLEFIPYINAIEYLLRLPDGRYELDFSFGLRNELANGTIYLEISAADKIRCRAYLSDLLEYKIDHITFPLLSCQNKAGAVTNVEVLKTYGKLLKIDFGSAEEPTLQSVSSDVKTIPMAKGFAAFQKGSLVELVPVLLKKDEETGGYSFFALGEITRELEMKCSDGCVVYPSNIGFGYKMRPYNLHNCLPW